MLNQIKNTYDHYIEQGLIENEDITPTNDILFDSLLTGDTRMMFTIIIKMNENRLIGEDEKELTRYVTNKINRELAEKVLKNNCETITYVDKVTNETRVKTLDDEQMRNNITMIQGLINKGNADEIFEKKAGGITGNISKKVKSKRKKLELTQTINKMKIVINMKIVKPYYLLKVMIQKIQIAKDILIFEIQSGEEVFIPKELSQDHLPTSFRYYDFILNYIMDYLSQDTKELIKFRNDLKLSFYKEHNSLKDIILKQRGDLSQKSIKKA